MRTLYTLLLYLLCPLVLARLVVRGVRNPAYLRRWGERFGFGAAPAGAVWIHAVSVGEARAAQPFIEALIKRGHTRLLITTMTPTGGGVVEQLRARLEGPGLTIKHRYVPYDLPGALRRFLRRARPVLLVVLETEIWPNLIHAAHARGIPVVYANVRLSQQSLRAYLYGGALFRPAMRRISAFAVQSETEAGRLVRLGADPGRVRVSGNVKFDIQPPPQLAEHGRALRASWGTARPAWVAGSTHQGEEAMALEAHARLRARFPQLLLVLAPRHPERFDAAARLCRRRGFSVVQRSDGGTAPGSGDGTAPGLSADVYLGDTMGELLLLYAATDVAFVGGSLVRTGGHNVLEPCALGRPVLFGPHMFNFHEISEQVLAAGAGRMTGSVEELERALGALLADSAERRRMGEAGKALVARNSGALDKAMACITPHLPAAAAGTRQA